MILKSMNEVPSQGIEGLPGVKKQILIGKDDGSNEVIARLFTLEPGGATPYHQHGFPHLVKVESGSGVVIDADGNEHPLEPGKLVYMPDDEIHGFKNTGSEPFGFICIVPERGEQ